MKTDRKILVTRHAAGVVRPRDEREAGAPTVAQARIRQRWSAAYIECGVPVESVSGHRTYDDAIGALIRQMARAYETPDEVFDFIAGLMSDLSFRAPNESMSRAVWIASRHPRRKHRGVIVEFPADMEFPGPAKSKGPKKSKPSMPKRTATDPADVLDAIAGAVRADVKVKGGVA